MHRVKEHGPLISISFTKECPSYLKLCVNGRGAKIASTAELVVGIRQVVGSCKNIENKSPMVSNPLYTNEFFHLV